MNTRARMCEDVRVIRNVRTSDGVDLHVEERGPQVEGRRGTLPRAMLLCNGLYCSTHYYGPWFDEFSSDHRVVSFDYRGHGQSADPVDPSTVTLEGLIGDAQAVFDTIDGPVVLVGHSMGVRVVLELAARAKRPVDAVVMLCGSVFDVGVGLTAAAASTLGPPLLGVMGRTAGLSRRVRDAVVHPEWMIAVGGLVGGLAPHTPRAPIEGLVRNVRRVDVRTMASLGRSYLEHSARPLLPRLKAPALQIVGALDRLAPPAHARAVERALPSISTVVVEGCTHLAPVEAPTEVHRAVRAFLGRGAV